MTASTTTAGPPGRAGARPRTDARIDRRAALYGLAGVVLVLVGVYLGSGGLKCEVASTASREAAKLPPLQN